MTDLVAGTLWTLGGFGWGWLIARVIRGRKMRWLIWVGVVVAAGSFWIAAWYLFHYIGGRP